MEVLRTPDQCFDDLPGYRFAPRYADVPDQDGGSSVSTTWRKDRPTAGASSSCTVEPSWSYLYRHMIPVLVDAGLRVVAPDLVGFGRSDKPTPRTEYTFARHVEWMRSLLFDPRSGRGDPGRPGLGRPHRPPPGGRAPRPLRPGGGGQHLSPDRKRGPECRLLAWLKFSQEVGRLSCRQHRQRRMRHRPQPRDDRRPTTAPFPDQTFTEGARQFPTLVPISPDDPATPANRAAWEVLAHWPKPFLTAFSDGDPITAGSDRLLRERIPGTRDQPHVTIAGGGHFLQEDKGPELARVVADFVAGT